MKKLISICAAAFVLGACGGGGGGGNPTPAVTYTGSTSTASIDSAASVGTLATAVKGSLSGLSGGVGSVTVMGAVQGPPRYGVKDAVSRVAELRKASVAVVSGVVQSASMACDGGGSITLTANDVDGNEATTSKGDYFQLAFNACADEFSTTYGTLRLEITATDGNDFLGDPSAMTGSYEYGIRLTYGDLLTFDPSGAFAGIDGDVSFGWIADPTTSILSYGMYGNSIVGIEGSGETVTAAFLLAGPGGTGQYSNMFGEYYPDGFALPPTESTSDFDGRVCSTEIGGCLDVVTDPSWWQRHTQAYPYQGAVTISDGSGAYITVAAVDGATGAITVTFDVDGPGTEPVAGPYATTWACLEADADSTDCF